MPSPLTRAIGLPHATAIVVGITIGASVFVQASEITARVPSLGGVTLAWVIAGLLTMGGALVCAELSSAFPRTGGVYVFLREIYTAEETKNPERTIPRALVLGTLVVTVCYVGLNIVYLSVLPIDRVIASSRVAADTFEAVVGPEGGSFVSGLVLLSALGALNGVILAGPRVYYSMAQLDFWYDMVRAFSSAH